MGRTARAESHSHDSAGGAVQVSHHRAWGLFLQRYGTGGGCPGCRRAGKQGNLADPNAGRRLRYCEPSSTRLQCAGDKVDR